MGGLAGSYYALEFWRARQALGRWNSDTDHWPRAVPTAAAMTLGFQIVLSSFFLSVLGLGRSRQA